MNLPQKPDAIVAWADTFTTGLLFQLTGSKIPVSEVETGVLTTELLVRDSTERAKGKPRVMA